MNSAEIFAQALTPITLISGVGLLLLSMVNRYNHLTTRARGLFKECKNDSQLSSPESVKRLLIRCKGIRDAILSLLMTVALAGLLVLLMVLERYLALSLAYVIWPILILSVSFLLLGIYWFAKDFKHSLIILRLDLS